MHPLRSEADTSRSAKRSHLNLASGGTADKAQDEAMIRTALAEHDKQLHGGKHTKLKFRSDGGAAEGESAKPRNDRMTRARGGGAKKGGGKTHINVIVAPQNHPPAPMGGGLGGPPMAPPIHPAGPPMPPPAPPPMAGPGMPPGGMPPRPMPIAPGGIPPRSRGGAVSRKRGGGVLENKKPTGIGIGEVGAGSGVGRLKKIASYGGEADDGEC